MNKNHCIYTISIICMIGFLYACSSKVQHQKFFDIPVYFQNEMEYIKTQFSKIEKTAIYNHDTSSQELEVLQINWKKELAIFLECDINKPAYYANMHAVNNPSKKDSVYRTSYRTDSEKLSIQSVDVDSLNGQVVSVQLRMGKTNLISTTFIHAVYEKDHFYKISGEQQVKILGDKNSFFVTGIFR